MVLCSTSFITKSDPTVYYLNDEINNNKIYYLLCYRTTSLFRFGRSVQYYRTPHPWEPELRTFPDPALVYHQQPEPQRQLLIELQS